MRFLPFRKLPHNRMVQDIIDIETRDVPDSDFAG